MATGTFSYFAAALGRTLAIRVFGRLARWPRLIGLLPMGPLRRQITVVATGELPYDGAFPQAVYAPWRGDQAFLKVYEAISANTHVDIYRCWELWDLIGQIDHLPPGDILEVGVWRGGSGALMAKRCQFLANTGSVFLCDTFGGVVKASSKDTAYVGGEHADTSRALVESLLSSMQIKCAKVLEGIFPDDTAATIEDRSFRLCHIDVDVHESARETFEWVWPRLVPGGIVVFDDYGFYSCGGVTRLVNAMRGQPDRLVFHNLNGHALVVKVLG